MIETVIHASLTACLSAYFKGEVPEEGRWVSQDANGVQLVMSMSEAIDAARKRNMWGWCEDKERIHVWICPKAELRDVVGLIAHERGHMERPWHGESGQEERKANKYRDVALFAVDAAQAIMNEVQK